MKRWIQPVILGILVPAVILVINTRSESITEEPTSSLRRDSRPISLTEEERAWLEAHPLITIGHDPSWPPIEFSDAQGNISGIAGDYMKLVQERLGVKFTEARDLSWQEVYDRQKRWEIDLASCVARTAQRERFWAFTKPYLNIPIVIATQANVTYVHDIKELFGKKVALVKDYAIDDWITQDFPEIDLMRVSEPLEGLRALQRGDVFAYIDNLLIIGDFVAKLKVTNIKIAGQTPYVNAQCMAVRKDWSPMVGILDKALDSFTESERKEIFVNWLPLRYEYGFDYGLLWKALAVFTVIIGALFLWIRRLAAEIATRKRTEAALLQSEANRAVLFNNVPDSQLLIRYEPEGQFTIAAVNRSYLQVANKLGFEVSEEAIVGLTLEAALRDIFGAAGEVIESKLNLYRQAATSGVPVYFEEDLNAPLGDYYSESSILPVTDDAGECSFLVYSSHDVTQRRRADMELRESERRLRLLTDNMVDAISRIDAERNLIYCSPSVERVFGIKAEELIGHNAYERIHSDDVEIVRRRALDAVAAHTPLLRVEYRYLHGRGDYVWVESSLRLLFDENGAYAGAIVGSRDITERKLAEEALRESEERFRQMAENMKEVFWLFDWRQQRVLYASPAYESIWGRNRAALYTRYAEWAESIHPEDLAFAAESFGRIIETGGGEPREYRIVRPDGSLRWVSDVGYAVKDSDGQVVRIAGIVEDITARKMIEESLRQANLVVENSPAVLFRWRATEGWPVSLVSQNVVQFGYTAQELLSGMIPFSLMVHPEDLDRVSREVAGYAAAGTDRFQQEYRIVTKNGTVRWVDDRTAVERGDDGKILAYQGILIDITERKQAEEALRESETGFMQLFELAPVPMAYTSDADGFRMTTWNQAWYRTFGYRRDEADARSGNDIGLWVNPDDRTRFLELVDRHNGVTDYEVLLRRKDGDHRNCLLFAQFIQKTGHRLLPLVYLDITDRRRTEQELRASLAEKESLLKEVHHRVKNNLQIISSLLSLQSHQFKDDAIRSFIHETQNRVRSMAMLHEMLYYSGNFAAIRLPAYIKSLCDHLARSYGLASRNIHLNLKITDLSLNLDQAITVGLIINELVSNAMKHAFSSLPAGEISVTTETADERHLILRIADNGVGLPVETHPETSGRLGLLLVSNLSRQLDGQLRMKSENGTHFEIIFPYEALRGESDESSSNSDR
jgi:PAS domain S-box-containing protein